MQVLNSIAAISVSYAQNKELKKLPMILVETFIAYAAMN
jgi:hypothetical protein